MTSPGGHLGAQVVLGRDRPGLAVAHGGERQRGDDERGRVQGCHRGPAERGEEPRPDERREQAHALAGHLQRGVRIAEQVGR